MHHTKRNVIFTNGTLKICEFIGEEANHFVRDIARVRIENFKDYPYFYDGTEDEELKYLQVYFRSPNTSILIVFDDNEIVGFSNSIPLSDESDEMKAPFLSNGLNTNKYLYLGECILDEPYRGRKLATPMFLHHENRAREMGFHHVTLVTVNRDKNHPLRHNGYSAINDVLLRMGYEKMEGMGGVLAWTSSETGKNETNNLSLWKKDII